MINKDRHRAHMHWIGACFLTIFLAITMLPSRMLAQHELSLYNMTGVPQRISQNPAFIPGQKFFIGFPFLSGVQSSFANPFSYNDAIERDSYDSITLRVENMLGKLEKNEQVRTYTALDVITFGTQVAKGRFFLGFGIRERLSQQVMVPVNLGNLLWYGNASPKVFGNHVNIAPEINAVVFDEWGASFSGYALQGKMTWGARLKYLSGRIDATTVRSEFDVFTDTATYEMTMRSDIEIRTAGIDDIEHYLDQRVSSLVFPGNNGFGADLGLAYRLNDRISLSASVLDIGFIRWKSQTMTIASKDPGEEFAFKGFTLQDFTDMLGNLDTFGNKLKDSIMDLVEFDTAYGASYTSWLPARYNLGGSYSLNEHHQFNLLLNAVSWRGGFFPALSLSYCYSIPRTLGLLVSYNLFNRQYTNIGAGLSLSAGPVQFYVISDNVPGLIFYRSTNNSSLQFGINFSINPRKERPPGDAGPEVTPEGTSE